MEPRPKLRFKRLSYAEVGTPESTVTPHSEQQSPPGLLPPPPPPQPRHSDLDLWQQRMTARIAAALEREKKAASGSLI
ncbi:hypothetical protein GL50803_007137 [Giardia duodenalis]|uniref:Uncharacterized protein n=1 Tax=Giardia intestinalis (strain ATCC 50803 / WB clone C6) TaxID=184922 RepID=A8BTC6_GIAIC|nr:hypothetical protein GL50803_007137 [Giardia intestinalis]KAE8302848.1 hypothetical protein GL50803_007137 [Giardia intestinalis]|eukprot:XP_001704963.1 Hypothetical protein GL50803_7137 [Giardia lamblia ATCC 50803]